MASNRTIQPIMDRHYHYNATPYEMSNYQMQANNVNYGNDSFGVSSGGGGAGVNDDIDAANRRYSSPQMGYYDLITGEYRYRSEAQNQSPLLTNYAGETEPPMCENTCTCCQVKLPFNCLTISLITSLMLLMMFSVFKMILGTTPKSNVNMSVFEDMIWLLIIISSIFLLLTIVKYSCLQHLQLTDISFCKRCKMFNEIIQDSDNKNVTYNAEQQNQYLEMGEDFV